MSSFARSQSASGSATASGSGSRSGSEALVNGPRLLRIDVTSDIICPYSLIGIRQLLLAIEIYNQHLPHAPIHPLIRMLPYSLNPLHSTTPMQRRLHRTLKHGSIEAGESYREGAESKLRKVGIEPCSDGLISSTHLAHRLQTLTLLRYPSRHLDFSLDLMMGYHTTPVHPSDREFLSTTAVRHGLFPRAQDALRWLDGDEYDYEVTRAYGVARRLGVTGVPFFVFGGRWAASGAVGVDDFVKLLHDIVHRETAGSTTPSPTSTLEMPEPLKEYISGPIGRQRVSAEREIKAEPQTHEAELLNFLARGDEGQYDHLPRNFGDKDRVEDLRLPRILGLN